MNFATPNIYVFGIAMFLCLRKNLIRLHELHGFEGDGCGHRKIRGDRSLSADASADVRWVGFVVSGSTCSYEANQGKGGATNGISLLLKS